MSTKIFTNISFLAGTGSPASFLRGHELSEPACIENAYLIIEGDTIAACGPMSAYRGERNDVPEGTAVLPAWCDSHTHLVFAGSREKEFIDKIKGLSYAEIAARGGGILQSAMRLNETPEDELFNMAWKRLTEIMHMGTGAIEIKSGYGLTVEGELKMLRVIRRLKEKSPIPVKATFLAAHAFPLQYRDHHEGYISEIVDRMLPVIGTEKLADFIDVFCEEGFFSPAEMETVCNAGKRYGLRPKLHVNQLHSIGGIEKGIECGALSLDHLETLTDKDISLLGSFDGAATLLPAAAFFLRMTPPPARRLIDAGAAVTLASDYNPGSAPSGNMNLVVALSCIQMKMFPEESIRAATINGAFAMGLGKDYGSIAENKKANIIFTHPVPSLSYLPYSFGHNHIDKVVIKGEFI